MKQFKLAPAIAMISLIFWLGLLYMKVQKIIPSEKISELAAQIEFIFHFFMLLLISKIYRQTKPEDRKIMIWLVVAVIALFLNDLAFYLVVYFPHNYVINLSVVNFILDIIPYTVWVITIIVFFSKILIRDIFNLHRFIRVFSVLIVINLIIIVLFLSSIQYAFGGLAWENISQVLSSMGELVIFDLGILCLMYCESKGLALLISGFIVLISGDFIINYSFLAQTDAIETYGELLWFLGLIFIFLGLLTLQETKVYAIKKWLREINTIKSKLAFWAFGIAIVNILPFFILAYLFSPLSQAVFLILPPFIMISSVLIVILSLFTSRNFERPFKQIANNIESLMLHNDTSKLSNDFSIKEFIFLQEFIADAYSLKEERDRAKKELGTLTAQVAHDIRSPLAALDMLIKNVGNRAMTDQERVMMRTAFRRINHIANDLVAKYKGREYSPDTLLFVYVVLKDIVSEKDLEYEHKAFRFELQLDDPASAFLLMKGNYKEMRRLFSNLINNAVNAMPKGGVIQIRCERREGQVCIRIRDQGCGLSKERISQLLSEDQAAEAGIGLGLKHAKEYVKQHEGKLSMESSLNVGTEIILTFPILPKPKWLAEKLEIDLQQPIMIIDDDSSIHELWTKKLEDFDVKREDFYTTAEAYQALQEGKCRPGLIVCDYEFIGQKEVGLDFLANIQEVKAHKYLVTTHVDNEEILDRLEALQLQIIPKHLLPYICIEIKDSAAQLKMPQAKSQKEVTALNAVLIDDDPYNHEFWQFAAKQKKKTLCCFTSLEEFESFEKQIPFETPIYIDLNLKNIRGLEVAKKLHGHGFTKLYISSGYIDFDPKDYPYLAGIIDKKPPF